MTKARTKSTQLPEPTPIAKSLANIGEWFDFKQPDYSLVFELRIKRLHWIREQERARPGYLAMLKKFYAENPAQFIEDWTCTYDPRRLAEKLTPTMPFILFPRQWEFIEWLHGMWLKGGEGLVEKSRDAGITWLCCAFAVWMWCFHGGSVCGFGSRKEDLVDKAGDPDSIFWKIRLLIDTLPAEFKPGWSVDRHSQHMQVVNPVTGAVIKGEAGKNIGRGGRHTISFIDEAAHIEQASAVDAALSQTSNCRIWVSTPNGVGNLFWEKRHSGRCEVFVFDWRDDPRKGQEWYEQQRKTLKPTALAQEVDRNYSASVANILIEETVVQAAQRRGPADVEAAGPWMIGLDVARFGDDRTVLTFRRGRLCTKQVCWEKADTTLTFMRVRRELKILQHDEIGQIAVDATGVGGGVADLLRGYYEPLGVDVVDVVSSETLAEDDPKARNERAELYGGTGEYYNLRTAMYAELADWLATASIPNDPELAAELQSQRYKFRRGKMLLWSKDELKEEGMRSPDKSDSLALTLAIPPKPKRAAHRPPLPGTELGVLDPVAGY